MQLPHKKGHVQSFDVDLSYLEMATAFPVDWVFLTKPTIRLVDPVTEVVLVLPTSRLETLNKARPPKQGS